tara:strand:+ start:104 stop:772 length:669 start_codon:yes stop_codon:yes gene_type:complete
MTDYLLNDISRKLARIALEIGAVRLSPDKPFTWASGYQMPIYNDNRLFLGSAEYRNLIARGFYEIIRANNIEMDVVAGAATAGIPHTAILANLLELPMIYVRIKPKGHGMKNQVEGPLQKHQKTLVLDDLISTGASVLSVVDAVREKGALVNHCLSIFSYGFSEAEKAFVGAKCDLYSLLTLSVLIDEAGKCGKINSQQSELLREWRQDPFGWGERKGFPKI